jgi:predicted metalloprotease
MRWKGRRQSENVEDRRGVGAGGVMVGGGIGTIVLALIVMMLGGNPLDVFRGLDGAEGGDPNVSRTLSAEDDARKEFVSVILADTEEVWTALFRQRGLTYQKPRLVLFTGQVNSACGYASSQVGPFYCGEDATIYIDTSFFDDLTGRFRAPGEFAQAYVIAHEVGHHVQQQLGILQKVQEARRRMPGREANLMSVRLELQADFFAGVWAHHAQRMASIDRQDIESGIRAAEAIGDDTLQREAQGRVVPDSFTHGSSEQRVRWFLRGFQTGDMNQGDTFRAPRL